MLRKMNEAVLGLFVRAKSVVNNERGAQTVEWVAIAAVVLFLLVAVAGAMEGNGSGVAQAITGKINELIGKVGSGGGN